MKQKHNAVVAALFVRVSQCRASLNSRPQTRQPQIIAATVAHQVLNGANCDARQRVWGAYVDELWRARHGQHGCVAHQ
jgi:hypothetical protein